MTTATQRPYSGPLSRSQRLAQERCETVQRIMAEMEANPLRPARAEQKPRHWAVRALSFSVFYWPAIAFVVYLLHACRLF